GDWWTYTLGVLAVRALDLEHAPRQALEYGSLSGAELALLAWTCDAGAPVSDPLGVAAQEGRIHHLLLQRTIQEGLRPKDIAEAAILYYAVRKVVTRVLESQFETFWQVNRNERDALALVVNLCRRFPGYARQLGRR